ncbi:hypothetical protein [Pseudoalteromonas luteoviolacea]|uniref:Uncharacterized protein n=3 Tax=Pseudoalteromonas luteoviolacea TaxID=43657 RepID=A0A161XYA2_9GAMM|nr:hypothetical protein [Pseudoalteromonas luteoviolacea]KZN30082.1 hypothetical protein N480_03815 [Pseudoalteromonas luteoviolacea S2607]KZN39818.1 hypothetical protein N475_13755 [Pseudoalteromonas luteoviolacea DSM 6061]KZN69431.1 hypothetical protein N478_12420 [Pseudoalteromonas luteoviolacea S4060-1]MBE0385757.1 hypothetical protein [Pseudoalteromonas luteoviolacea DSM 6061]MBQ4814277.1 hypothetical protein [Pseudoalteromonas luteoviolacea]
MPKGESIVINPDRPLFEEAQYDNLPPSIKRIGKLRTKWDETREMQAASNEFSIESLLEELDDG